MAFLDLSLVSHRIEARSRSRRRADREKWAVGESGNQASLPFSKAREDRGERSIGLGRPNQLDSIPTTGFIHTGPADTK